MVAFYSFPYLGAAGVVSRSQMCLWNSRVCVPTGKRDTHDWLSYGTKWNKRVHKREMKGRREEGMINSGTWTGRAFWGRQREHGSWRSQNRCSWPCWRKKYTEVCSQTIDSKMTRRVEELRLLKKQMCRESRRTGRRLCWGNSWGRGKV